MFANLVKRLGQTVVTRLWEKSATMVSASTAAEKYNTVRTGIFNNLVALHEQGMVSVSVVKKLVKKKPVASKKLPKAANTSKAQRKFMMAHPYSNAAIAILNHDKKSKLAQDILKARKENKGKAKPAKADMAEEQAGTSDESNVEDQAEEQRAANEDTSEDQAVDDQEVDSEEDAQEAVEDPLEDKTDEELEAAIEQPLPKVEESKPIPEEKRGFFKSLFSNTSKGLRAVTGAVSKKFSSTVDTLDRYSKGEATDDEKQKLKEGLGFMFKCVLGVAAVGGLAYFAPTLIPLMVNNFLDGREHSYSSSEDEAYDMDEGDFEPSTSSAEDKKTQKLQQLVQQVASYLSTVNPEELKDE